MNISEAARKGISRVRLEIWADKDTYLKIDLMDNGTHGPWGHLYSRKTQESIGEPTPQDILLLSENSTNYVEYTGELNDGD